MKHKLFNKVYPYTYYIRRKSDGLQYYGSRYANVSMGISPMDDLGKRYYSSGKFKDEFSSNPSNFEIKICNTFDSIGECVEHELKVVYRIYKRNSWINANRNHLEFEKYLLTISQHPSVQSQKKIQRNKGVWLLNNSGGVL